MRGGGGGGGEGGGGGRKTKKKIKMREMRKQRAGQRAREKKVVLGARKS